MKLNGSTRGASIVMVDMENNKIPLGTPTAVQHLQRGDNLLQFSAYLQGASENVAIVLGDFQSVANFTLAYQ